MELLVSDLLVIEDQVQNTGLRDGGVILSREWREPWRRDGGGTARDQ